MDIKIEERLIGRVTVLDIVGALTSDQAARRLKDKVNCLVSHQRTQIVLNLRQVPQIDSGGLGQLVASYGLVMKAGGALKLLNVGPRNHDRFSITRLVTLFDSFDSEVDAVQSFQTVAPPRDAAAATRASSEDARGAAEDARKAGEEARIDTLDVPLEEMKTVEEMRRTLRGIQDVTKAEPNW